MRYINPINKITPTIFPKKSLSSVFCIALCEGGSQVELEFRDFVLFGSKPKIINPRIPRNNPKRTPSVVSLPFCLAM